MRRNGREYGAYEEEETEIMIGGKKQKVTKKTPTNVKSKI